MKILFTGASSFTGYWFVKELSAQGHEVHATFRSSLEEYQGIRRERVDFVLNHCIPHFRCSFGNPEFLDLCTQGADVLCHHAAEVANYKSEDFDVVQALAHNTRNFQQVLTLLKPQSIVLTGSVFEKGEGICSDHNRPFSPYALSKSFTWDWVEYVAKRESIELKKFVIPNPFGPYEEERFTSWLVKNWMAGEIPEVQTPSYVRDNIHICLLAKAYAHFICKEGLVKFHPAGYRTTQEEFTKLFASKMRYYLGLPCEFSCFNQVDFPEPRVRVNSDPFDPGDWDEELAWKELADYYQHRYAGAVV